MREILADAAFIPHHIGHVSVNVGGVGFVFEVTVEGRPSRPRRSNEETPPVAPLVGGDVASPDLGYKKAHHHF